MTDHGSLLPQRHVALVACVQRLPTIAIPVPIDEERRQIEILRLPRRVPELHQRDLQLLVTGRCELRHHVPRVVHEYGLDVSRVFLHQTEKARVPHRIVIGDRRLDQMTRTVQLVVVPVREAMRRIDHGVVNVEVAVRMLVFLDLVDEGLYLRPQCRIVVAG